MVGPFLDPSFMLLDPQFTDRFAVVQRVQVVSNYGEASTANTTINNVLGVVAPAKPAELARLGDNERGARTLTIFTQFLLVGPARAGQTQRQPDLVLWSGDQFIVKEVLPWSRFGPGWVRAIVTSIDSIEAVSVAHD